MASQAYFDWINAGSPKKFSRPITAIANKLRAHGYTVYQEGNTAHLQHVPPEDHTFFSATGWPGKTPYPYCNAADIMPPTAGQMSKITGERLPSLQQLSAKLYADKQAGVPGAAFLKYMNREPLGNNVGPCYHESWMPDHDRINSGDRGHIHLSGRSDSVTSSLSDNYDLVLRVTGEDDMSAAEAQQGFADSFRLMAETVGVPPTDENRWGRQVRDNVNKVVDFAVQPMADAVTALTALVVAESPATADEIASVLAPAVSAIIVPQLLAAIEADGGTPLTPEQIEAVVEAGTRKVLGSLDN